MLKKLSIFDTFFLLLIKVIRPQKLLISTNEVLKILLYVGKKL